MSESQYKQFKWFDDPKQREPNKPPKKKCKECKERLSLFDTTFEYKGNYYHESCLLKVFCDENKETDVSEFQKNDLYCIRCNERTDTISEFCKKCREDLCIIAFDLTTGEFIF